MPRSFDSVFYGAAGGGVELPSDDQFNRVSFLSPFEGSNNGVNNAFEDDSGQSRSLSNYGNPAQGSSGPFARPDGEWGVALDGSGDYLSIASSADFALGTGDFTVEFFVYHAALPSATTYFDYRNTSNQATLYLWQAGSTGAFNLRIDGVNHAFTPPSMLGRWAHIAISRSSSITKLFVDGTQYLSFSDSTDYVQGTTFTISKFYNGNENVNGAISNFRWVKGTAVYTSAFTTPTSKLTAITNTKLLTCQSNRFVDNSGWGHTVTPTGNAAVTAFGPFLTSAVYDAAVNGASSQLGAINSVEIATGTWAQLGTGDFTWEYWIYPIAVNNYHLGSGTSGQNLSSTFTLGMSGKQLILYYTADGTAAHLLATSGTPEYNLNEWHHLAYVRAGNVHKIYANGILATSTTRSGAMANSTGPTVIGQFGTGSGVYGYGAEGIYCDVRLVKGTAVYSGSNYTVPTAPLTAISGTELLLNFKNGQAIDSAAQNNLKLFGNAKISTGQAKFGDTSLLLDGTGDFVHLPNRPNLAGPFCIETWARADDTGNAFLWCLGQYRLELGINGNTLRIYRIGTATGYTNFFTGGEFTANNWHHVALVRDNSSVIKCYLNGTASGTTVTDSTAFVATNNIFIIGGESSGAPSGGAISLGWDGYVDDFRISDFARYTTNFSVPSKPFADKGQ